jgi:hypothetical protein
MILSPDDHRSLQAIDGELATCEPHLAAMFRIFSRLNADEAPPPSEDLIVAVPSPAAAPAAPGSRRGWRGRGRRRSQAARAWLRAQGRTRSAGPGVRSRTGGRPGSARRGLWRPVAAIGVPAVLLVTVLVVMVVTLTSSMKCRPAPASSGTTARTSAPVMPGNGSLAACQQSTKTGASG